MLCFAPPYKYWHPLVINEKIKVPDGVLIEIFTLNSQINLERTDILILSLLIQY